MRRCFLSLAAALSLVACQAATDAQSHLVLTMSIDRTSLGAGDTTHLTLTLRNYSSKSISVPSSGCGPYFSVTDAVGRPAGPPQIFCFADFVSAIDLAAGDSLTYRDSWAADSGGPSSGTTRRVDPGIYTIRGVLAGPEHPIISNAIPVQVQGSN